MSKKLRVLVTGGGTGGHVIPAIAVARELRERGHEALFVGSRKGLEAKLAPAAGFPIEWIEIGGLNRVGLRQTARTLFLLPMSLLRAREIVLVFRPHVVFSTGGFVSGPVMVAAAWLRVPIVVMEPNAVPGLTNRRIGRFVSRALLNFEETARYFPPNRSSVTGVPIRPEFFSLVPNAPSGEFTVLITGGSRGSRTLNNAARESWPLFKASGLPIRLLHLTGPTMCPEMTDAFGKTGLPGAVWGFADNMAELIQQSDLLISRSGAGALAEIAAAGKPAILVPFPFAADQHQLRNAQALERAGAAILITDSEMNGHRLFDEVSRLASEPEALRRFGAAICKFAYPEAAIQAAGTVEAAARE